MSIGIRPAQADDAGALRIIRREAIMTLATKMLSEDQALEWANSAVLGRFQRAIEVHQVFVAVVEGKVIAEQVVGWVEIDANQIEGLYVQPDRAGQGVGSALLAYAEGQIWTSGHHSALVYASWNAEQFYINRGYHPLSDRSPATGLPMVKHIVMDTAL